MRLLALLQLLSFLSLPPSLLKKCFNLEKTALDLKGLEGQAL